MNYKSSIIVIFSTLFLGCNVLSHRSSLDQAKSHLEFGEYYKARKLTEGVLREEPGNAEAERLMAQILDGEIGRHKEAFEEKVPEEYTPEEKSEQIRTWLERGRMYLDLHYFEQALWSTEQVFLFEPGHVEASRLVDEIRREAHQAGKGEELRAHQVVQEESRVRVERYRQQARRAIEGGRWGEAKLAAEKILLLSPKDVEGLRLQEKIKVQGASREA